MLTSCNGESDIDIKDLPALNAAFNTCSTFFLLAAYYCIRRRKVHAHRRLMLAALCTSSLFLASYLIYHYSVGSIPFTGEGNIRVFYFVILISHTILAAAVPILAILSLTRALQRRFDRHKSIARWTLPIWLYVSVTGVAIYLMLYVLYPSV